jgi:hypothetical protein
MTEPANTWQPGELAVYRSWNSRTTYDVRVLRYSRRRNSNGHLVLVQRIYDGRRFSVSDSCLVPVSHDAD